MKERLSALVACRENEELIAKLSAPREGSRDLYFKHAYPQSQLRQLALLLEKDLITYWRSPNYNAVRFVFTVILALIIGAIYWGLGARRWAPSLASCDIVYKPLTIYWDLHPELALCFLLLACTSKADPTLPYLLAHETDRL